MALVAFTSARGALDNELAQSERIATTMSSRFAALVLENLDEAIVGSLEEVRRAVAVDECILVELGEAPNTALQYWGGQTSAADLTDLLPGSGAKERSASSSSTLTVPVSVAGPLSYALVLKDHGRRTGWPPPLIDRLRLIGEILGGALHRRRQERALREMLTQTERPTAQLEADNRYLQEEIKSYHDVDDIVGQSAPLRDALTRLMQVASMNSTVLLLGETGTGKELFARALHDRSRRHARALVRVNCAALPQSLIESELFGHERGAFTGAVSMRQGRFEIADGGTIFLDEIGDLPLDLQAKLLRVIQEGEFERVGSSRSRKVDVRVITATHRNLEQDVADGRFRADLFYRLSVFPIHLPALRERTEDIPALVWFFIHRHQRELERRIAKVPQAVMSALQQHAWPGNIRELENVIERAMIRTTGDTLRLDDDTAGMATRPLSAFEGDSLDAIQRLHIERILRECGWRINGTGNAAERLGLHPNTLRFRMQKLGVVCPGGRLRKAPARSA
jgi:transcriptional regulator with GAF, ATPase, and Fis domain